MSKRSKLGGLFSNGITFLKEHPQLWTTALVGVVIVLSFIFIAWRFASIAENAQKELVNVRVGSILDAFVLFAPDIIEDKNTLHERISSIKKQNPTIDSFVIYAEHGNGNWRVYLSDGGPLGGTVVTDVPIVFNLAKTDTGNAYTFETVKNNERYFITARAITDSFGKVTALAVTEQGVAESDKDIANNIRASFYILFVVLLVIMFLFFRHARIVDFATLYKKQLEIDEMKDSFISMASHELKSPLSVIRGYVEFLKDGVKDNMQRQEFLRRIDVSANELKQLVDDILDVSRIEMGRLKFSVDYVKSYDVLKEVYEMFENKAKDKGLVLLLAVEDAHKDVTLRLDRGRLKQVVINLVSNAVKYTMKGEVKISQKVLNGNVEISVRDTGIGMTSEEQKKLFGKFYRIEDDKSKGVSGTGLGLWITKYIVEQMNGKISVESIKGDGSRFVVIFPINKKQN